MAKVEKIIWEAVEPIIEENGCSVYDIEFVKEGQNYFLRIFIDKEDGVSTDDCEKISRAVDPVIDEIDPIEPSYYLEISSPGLDRKLSRQEHFDSAIGSLVDIKLFAPINGSKDITAYLKGFDGKTIFLETENGAAIELEKQKASSIRLTVVL